MATYKLIQDIEAEDKILGPLTLRQFIFALIAALGAYICVICVKAGASWLLALFLPPTLFAAFFAFPFGKDQPTEVWALAKIRFYFKPRKRIWDQSGVKELVTITVPKKVERMLTNGLSQNEVHNRLKTLASTIDSRGWAIKNSNVSIAGQHGQQADKTSDRLLGMSSMPQEVPDYEVQASDDILDETNNPIAQQFDHMITTSTQTRRQQLLDELKNIDTKPDVKPNTEPHKKEGDNKPPVTPNDYWFLHQPSQTELPPSQAMFSSAQIVAPGTDDAVVPAGKETPDEAALVAQFKAHNSSQQVSYGHLRTLQPLGSAPPPPIPSKPAEPTVSTQTATDSQQSAPSAPAHDPAILSLANNNDLNVATLAREAYKAKNPEELSQDEVVISLH